MAQHVPVLGRNDKEMLQQDQISWQVHQQGGSYKDADAAQGCTLMQLEREL